MGVGSRKEIKEMAKRGRIRLGDRVIRQTDQKCNPEEEAVYVDGKKISYVPFEYYIMNKPQGVISASFDREEQTVVGLIKERIRDDLFPVGRLDKDTEGLLVITNDGNLSHQLLSPVKHVSKTYFAVIEGLVTEADVKLFEEGLLLKDQTKTRPARLTILKTSDADEKISEVEVTIVEGKYHQVKRMFASCGKHVRYLKRLSMGALQLDPALQPGEYRAMTEDEIALLKKECGGDQ